MSFTIEAYKAEAILRGRELTRDKPWTYDEVYQAYKRKWLSLEEYKSPHHMPHPEEFLYTKREDDMDIALSLIHI